MILEHESSDSMTTRSNKNFQQQDQQNYLQTFKRYPLTLTHGKGSHVWDVEGNEYIDALAGIAVNSIGHAHPHLVKSLQDQVGKLIHISNFYLSEPQVELSTKLVDLSGMDRVFFTNSGAESVEGAIKLARKYAHSNGRGGTIISFEGSFHGRTMATIATGKKAMQQGFHPIPTGFNQIPFDDIEAVKKAAADKETAAFIIEPIQGEGGINVNRKSFLKELRDICSEHDIVLIFDEIQCGMGRTGHWFAKDYFDVEPDIMTLAKALGGGVPVGAFLAREAIASAIDYGDHGTTFGGNPLACVAALATIEVIEKEGLLEQASKKGDWFKQEVMALNEPTIQEVRGVGLMLGIVFDFETKPLAADLIKHGILANATAGNVLRLVPPLNIPKEALKAVIEAVQKCIQENNYHEG